MYFPTIMNYKGHSSQNITRFANRGLFYDKISMEIIFLSHNQPLSN